MRSPKMCPAFSRMYRRTASSECVLSLPYRTFRIKDVSNSTVSCGTRPMRRRMFATASSPYHCPSMYRCPRSGTQNPNNRRSSVVFPHPMGPTTAVRVPRANARERWSNTRVP